MPFFPQLHLILLAKKKLKFHIFSFILVVLDRYPDDEEVRLFLENINTNIQKQKKGKKGTTKKNLKTVGTSLCLPDPGEHIFRMFKDLHYEH